MEHLGNLLPPGPAERLEEELHVARGLLPLPPRRTKQMTNHNNPFHSAGGKLHILLRIDADVHACSTG